MKAVESVDQLVQVIQPACQSLIVLAQLTDRRVTELLEPWTKVSLTQAREVVKGSSTLMVSSTKAFVTNIDKPSKESAKESRRLCIERLLHAIDDIERIVQIKQVPPEDKANMVSNLAKDRIRLREAMVDIQNAVINQSPEGLAAAYKIFDPAADNILANARAIANSLQNPQRKAEILQTISNIEKMRKDLAAAAKYALEHPEDAAAQQRFLDLLRATEAEFDKLDRQINEALLEEVNASLATLGNSNNPDSTLAKLVAAALAGDMAAFNIYAKKLQEEAAALRKLADQVAERSTDPEAIRAIREAQKFLDDLLPQVISAAKTVALNPTDPAAKEHLTAVVAEWESGVGRLKGAIENAQSNEDIIQAAADGIRQDMKKFQEACKKQDAALLKEASLGITQKIQSANAAIQREIDNSDDPAYQQQLRSKMLDMQNTLPELQQKAKNAFLNPNDAAAQKALMDTGDKLVAKLYDIKDTIHQHNNPNEADKWADMERHIREAKEREAEKKRLEEELRRKSEAEKAELLKREAERRKREEEEARRLAAEEAAFLKEQEALRLASEAAMRDNPIKAAALNMKREANKWDSEGNILIQMAQDLAEQLALLAELSKLNTPDAKKKMIEISRKIAVDSKVIETEAKKIANNCTDKRLKNDLMVVAERVGTIANQVKILATVKAANPNDHDNDQMLFGSCTNLVNTVTAVIDRSHSATIRSFATTATVVTAALKWKRKAAHREPQSLASVMKTGGK